MLETKAINQNDNVLFITFSFFLQIKMILFDDGKLLAA